MRKGLYSLEEWCGKMNRPELLALYDRKENPLPPSEVPFSSGKNYKFRCPVCNISWEHKPNKLNRLRPHDYNVIKRRSEATSCPYCAGERPSPYYNLLTVIPEAGDWWDPERNTIAMDRVLPSTHQAFYLRCPECGYQLPAPVRIKDRDGAFLCPVCGNGRNTEVTEANCLAAAYPQIAGELDDARNGGITGRMVLPSFPEKLWFICPNKHRYQARVSNRAYLGRGCPICNERKQTSFAEQAFRFYLQKCTSEVLSCQEEPHTGRSVDILLPGLKTAIEFNSLYYHATVNKSRRTSADLNKVYALAQYYRVYVVAEEGAELPLRPHPLVQLISVPVFALNRRVCRAYDHVIFKLLRALFPDRDAYPSIDMMRDQLLILQQYVRVPIENSFEARYPLLARDWHPALNGHLTPSMFAPTASYKFYWVCRGCGKPYQASMSSRIKTNPDTCPFCRRKGRYKSRLLSEAYPFLKSFWNEALNAVPFSQVLAASEKFGVFELYNGGIVPVRICDLSDWLRKYPERRAEEYLSRRWEESRQMLNGTRPTGRKKRPPEGGPGCR